MPRHCCSEISQTQRIHDSMITSLLRQNDVATSFLTQMRGRTHNLQTWMILSRDNIKFLLRKSLVYPIEKHARGFCKTYEYWLYLNFANTLPLWCEPIMWGTKFNEKRPLSSITLSTVHVRNDSAPCENGSRDALVYRQRNAIEKFAPVWGYMCNVYARTHTVCLCVFGTPKWHLF